MKLAPAQEYRFGEHIVVKPLLAVKGLRRLRRLNRSTGGGKVRPHVARS